MRMPYTQTPTLLVIRTFYPGTSSPTMDEIMNHENMEMTPEWISNKSLEISSNYIYIYTYIYNIYIYNIYICIYVNIYI
jgi:hypothetical protein